MTDWVSLKTLCDLQNQNHPKVWERKRVSGNVLHVRIVCEIFLIPCKGKDETGLIFSMSIFCPSFIPLLRFTWNWNFPL